MTTDNQDSMWITNRRPLPVDANENDVVKVQLWPESNVYVYMHRANVGLGTPWSHCQFWRFPDICIGQIWRCEDGKERVVQRGDSNNWLIGEYWYTSDGEAPGAPRTLTSIRLAELISDPLPKPKPSPIPPAIRSGAEAFYVLVADNDVSGREDWVPIAFETPIPVGSTFEAARNRQFSVGSKYGTTYVAECRIMPASAKKP